MKKVLAIYYCWDEEGNANGNQNIRQYKYLSTVFQMDVLYRKFTNKIYGKSFIDVSSPNFRILDALLLKIFPFLRLIFSFDILYWAFKAFQCFKSKTLKFDVVLLTGTPYMLFHLAKYISKKSNAKLVVQMYDPLSMNNFVSGSSYFRSKHELYIIRNADLMIIHSKLLYDLMIERYSIFSHKFQFVSFSSDSFFSEKVEPVVNNKLSIIHAGTINGNRNLRLLIRALESDLNLIDKIDVFLIGNIDNYNKKLLNKSRASGCFTILPFMCKDELRNYLVQADALLVIDSFKDNINVFFPSKLCELILLNKPIILFTPSMSESRRLFKKSSDLVFAECESNKLATALNNLIKDRSFYNYVIDPSVPHEFEYHITGKKLAQFINTI
ncbi:MAG: hypothetical protein ACRDD6_11230 [Tannerellaceae bacterium]